MKLFDDTPNPKPEAQEHPAPYFSYEAIEVPQIAWIETQRYTIGDERRTIFTGLYHQPAPKPPVTLLMIKSQASPAACETVAYTAIFPGAPTSDDLRRVLAHILRT